MVEAAGQVISIPKHSAVVVKEEYTMSARGVQSFSPGGMSLTGLCLLLQAVTLLENKNK